MAVRILAGLVAGLVLGMLVSATDSPALASLTRVLEPIGTLFLNAIRMTVVPLVVAKLIVGVGGSATAGGVGRLGAHALGLFVLVLSAAALFSVLVSAPLLQRLPIDGGVAETLRAGDAARAVGEVTLPTAADWLAGLFPSNVIAAAADGAMVPLILCSLLFGLALKQIDAARRDVVLALVGAVGDAMLTVIRWVLVAAPVGVFALAVPIAARLGLAAAGALASYLLLVGLVCTAFALLVLYPAAALGGGVSLVRFARAVAPAQAIGFSSRSSLASLPVLIEEGRTRLGHPDVITSFFLPLGSSTFWVGSALGLTVGALFLARLYGIELHGAQLATLVLTVVVTTFGSPGVPSGAVLVIMPALMAAGIPAEGIGLLLGVDTVPDMFRTATNVTGNMTAATILAVRSAPASEAANGPRAPSSDPEHVAELRQP